ncbi:ALBINO3-like protein 1 chloroplastic [Tripterygium wilfordii]|uniref:ALBINO3-like protein 1 chloroplastic n=1 Tax=Tripterygium wilfordii TaxID=458696 RepID=A0A7J7DJJ0_TRIWF|nr:ALBINO3-like protein 1 chloroplastic [Tripterygium wilfordii]
MFTFLSLQPNIVLSPFPNRTGTSYSLLHRTQFSGISDHRPSLRGSLHVARSGFMPGMLPDPDGAEGAIKELFGRAESILYTIADVAVSTTDTVNATTKQNNDWFSGITYYMESVLKVLKDGLSTLHVPYAYGFAIIMLTVLVKAATFPLTKKQVESAMAMRSFQPQVKAIQQRYAGDQEKIQLETARLYKLAGINPFAGCLPTLATIPVWIGLYRALSNVADEGLLTEGFFWIPSLAGPTTIASRQSGSGISWLFPFVDGHPPLGWSDTLAYLVLPVLLVAAQYISVQIMQSSQSNDPSMKNSQALTKILPLMIGYFALSVPSGLSLYWLTNNILSTAQQVWLQKLGGAKNPVTQLSTDVIEQEQQQLQKSPPELNSTQSKAGQVEKLTSEGPHPGERFKQLKEQEARRRKQREEEKKQAEKGAKANQTADEVQGREVKLLGRENGAGVVGYAAVEEKSENFHSLSLTQDSSNDSNEGRTKTSMSGMENSDISANHEFNRTDQPPSYDSEGKEAIEALTRVASAEKKHTEEDTQQVRIE